MKIRTSDGKVFNVPEENLESFLAEYESTKKTFAEANAKMADIDRALHPGGKFGYTRNVLKGLVPGAARAEATLRSGSVSNEDYEKYKKWAERSAQEYAEANPGKAMRARIAGALVPSAIATALSFGTASAPAAANVANAARVASVANTLNKAKLAERSLRGLGGGAGVGALYGFMDEPSESLADRLGTATGGAIFGGAVGGLAPLGLSATGTALSATKRFFKGIPLESLTPQQVEDFVLKSGVLKNTPEMALDAEVLRRASAAGATDIYKPLYNMKETIRASSGMKKPEVLYNPVKESASAYEILSAGKAPEIELAAKRYADFVKSVKDTPGQGLVAKEFLKRNPVAKEAIKGHPAFKDLPVGSFEWFKNMNSALDNIMPKNIQDKSMTLRNNKLLTAKEDLKNIREMIHPGSAQADLDYAVGKAWETEGRQVLSDRLSEMANLPTEKNPSISSKELLAIFTHPYKRGKARELIKKGDLYLKPSAKTQAANQILDQAIFNAFRLY